MRYKEVSHILAHFLFIFSVILLIPLCISIYYDFFVLNTTHPYPTSFTAFSITILITLFLASTFKVIGRKAQKRFYRKESLLLVFFIWVFVSFLGATPFYITKTIESPIDAIFESVSGFTTTGASILLPKKYDPVTKDELFYTKKIPNTKNHFTYKGTIKDYINPYTGETLRGFQAISNPLLFWRSFIQWLGGIGIVFIFIALFPGLSLGGKFLYQAESHPALHESTPQEVLRPRVKEVSSYLWKIYLCLTVLEILLLYLTNPNMELFDAICISFSTISTGGFAIHSNGIAYYQDSITQWIIIAFMLIGATNFALFFYLIKAKFKKIFNAELFLFWILAGFCSLLVIWKLYENHITTDPIRAGLFQTVSSLTCTGFNTENYDIWPFPCQAIMIIAMFLGGMTGSTSGGIKTSRHIILFLSFKKKLQQLYRPNLIKDVKIGSIIMDQSAINNVFIFFWIVISVSALFSMLYIFDGLDLETAISLTACNINNVGLAFKMAAPGNSCAFLPPFSKILSIILMLLGRLEFFSLFIIFTPSFWKEG